MKKMLMPFLLLMIAHNANAYTGWEVRVPYLPDDSMVIVTSFSEMPCGVYYGPIRSDGTAGTYHRLPVPAYGMASMFKSDFGIDGNFWLWLWSANEFGVVVVGPEGAATYYGGRGY